MVISVPQTWKNRDLFPNSMPTVLKLPSGPSYFNIALRKAASLRRAGFARRRRSNNPP